MQKIACFFLVQIFWEPGFWEMSLLGSVTLLHVSKWRNEHNEEMGLRLRLMVNGSQFCKGVTPNVDMTPKIGGCTPIFRDCHICHKLKKIFWVSVTPLQRLTTATVCILKFDLLNDSIPTIFGKAIRITKVSWLNRIEVLIYLFDYASGGFRTHYISKPVAPRSQKTIDRNKVAIVVHPY